MRCRETSLRIAGLGLIDLLTVVIGLVLVFVGVGLGALNNQPTGGMVCLLVGIGMIVSALLFRKSADFFYSGRGLNRGRGAGLG